MTNVFLYGELKNKFGGEFRFNINSSKEAFLAINANRKGFLDEIKKLAAKGVYYRIIVDDNVINNLKELDVTKPPKEIHLMPIVWGAGRNAGIIMAVLAIAAIVAQQYQLLPAIISKGGAYAAAFTATMAAIAVQGVTMMLYSSPKPDFNQEVAAGGKSYLFGSKSNNMSQGQAVPVGYGRLLIGSSQVSSNFGHYPLKTDVKTLMTPVDRPIDDYTDLEFSNEDETATVDSFYTNQAMGMDESLSFTTVNILNSYSSIISRSVAKVTTEPVEVVVKRNSEIISNPNLPNYDTEIQYLWEDMSSEINKGKVKIENPYSFSSGIVYRSYFAKDFSYYSNLVGTSNTGSSYFISYPQNSLVRYGPAQFRTLIFANWDSGYVYASGELAKLTGTTGDLHYKSVTGHSGIAPNDLVSGATCWNRVSSPPVESIYRAKHDVTGWLPSDTNAWQQITSPTGSGEFNDLINYFGSPYKSDAIHGGVINGTNINRVFLEGTSNDDARLNADNYAMEFLGFYRVPFVKNREINIADAENGVMYEVIKPGATGVQWTGAGLTGQGGTPIPVVAGMTFTKNSNQVTGDGTVLRVASYRFKLDSDDASDLYIDGQLASSYYGNHGMYSGFADYQNPTEAEIQALHSTTTEIPLTVGYHRLYARFQDGLGGEGISIYRKLDTNGDNVYSNWQIAPKEELYHRKISDFSVSKADKFLSKNQLIPASSMVIGKKYKIGILGTVNWGSIGASSPRVGTVFIRRAGTITGSGGFVFEDTFSHYESTAANSNRMVTFSSERPTKNGEKIDNGLSYYQSKYRCKVIVDNEEQNTAPVKINIRFLPTQIPIDSSQKADLSVQAFTDV
jgi:predicted phage tail protein